MNSTEDLKKDCDAFAGDKELRPLLLGDLCRLEPRVASWGPAKDLLFIQIVLKTRERESVMERTIQYVGIGASIISIIKVRNSISQKACNSKDIHRRIMPAY